MDYIFNCNNQKTIEYLNGLIHPNYDIILNFTLQLSAKEMIKKNTLTEYYDIKL